MTPKDEVEAAIHRFFRSMDEQDAEMFEALVGHDDRMVHIGTDTGEIWTGWDDLRAATREQFEGLEFYDATIRDLRITLSESGDVAWYAHLLDARIRSNGHDQVWTGARFTGVFEKREGQWKMVQTHVSLPESAHSDGRAGP